MFPSKWIECTREGLSFITKSLDATPRAGGLGRFSLCSTHLELSPGELGDVMVNGVTVHSRDAEQGQEAGGEDERPHRPSMYMLGVLQDLESFAKLCVFIFGGNFYFRG